MLETALCGPETTGQPWQAGEDVSRVGQAKYQAFHDARVFKCAWAENSSPANLKKTRTLNAQRGMPGTEASVTSTPDYYYTSVYSNQH